jgi:ribosomal protein S18 acetylase RimI-like enzyme
MSEKIEEIKVFTPEIYRFVCRLMPQLIPNRDVFTENAFREMLDSENAHLFVLQNAEGTLVGMLSVGFYRTPSGSKAWIEDVVVDAAYRGCGYGKKIVEHAIGFIRNSGVDSISLTTNSSRIVANQLYPSLGFEKYETNVYKMYVR